MLIDYATRAFFDMRILFTLGARAVRLDITVRSAEHGLAWTVKAYGVPLRGIDRT
jgi:hypothetical protein